MHHNVFFPIIVLALNILCPRCKALSITSTLLLLFGSAFLLHLWGRRYCPLVS
jgi:hypothetical protein